uniref:Predicted gene 45521 n=1 Tax=Nannospalax galili TaxID=1026970 RepID=A0A8C6W2J2_NANGA
MKELFNSPNQNQACWRERIKKEVVARTTWNIRYSHKYLKEGTRPKKQPQQPPFASASRAGIGPVSATSFPVRKEVQVGQSQTRGIQDQLERQVRGAPQDIAAQGRPEDLEMKRPSPATLKLLFHGISHEGQGRALYLRERHQLTPEKKFKYPMVSSWEYGWHTGDSIKNYRTPAYAKVQPITKTFFAKNGIFHFPQ